MKGIKTTLTFLLGAIFASLWWASFMPVFKQDVRDLCLVGAISISCCILFGSILWIMFHWNE